MPQRGILPITGDYLLSIFEDRRLVAHLRRIGRLPEGHYEFFVEQAIRAPEYAISAMTHVSSQEAVYGPNPGGMRNLFPFGRLRADAYRLANIEGYVYDEDGDEERFPSTYERHRWGEFIGYLNGISERRSEARAETGIDVRPVHAVVNSPPSATTISMILYQEATGDPMTIDQVDELRGFFSVDARGMMTPEGFYVGLVESRLYKAAQVRFGPNGYDANDRKAIASFAFTPQVVDPGTLEVAMRQEALNAARQRKR